MTAALRETQQHAHWMLPLWVSILPDVNILPGSTVPAQAHKYINYFCNQHDAGATSHNAGTLQVIHSSDGASGGRAQGSYPHLRSTSPAASCWRRPSGTLHAGAA